MEQGFADCTPAFADELHALMERVGYSRADLVERVDAKLQNVSRLGVSARVFNWLRGRCSPSEAEYALLVELAEELPAESIVYDAAERAVVQRIAARLNALLELDEDAVSQVMLGRVEVNTDLRERLAGLGGSVDNGVSALGLLNYALGFLSEDAVDAPQLRSKLLCNSVEFERKPLAVEFHANAADGW